MFVYPCWQSLVMCGNTFNMTGTEVIEGYGTFKHGNMAYPCLQSLESYHVIPISVRFHKPSQVLLWNP